MTQFPRLKTQAVAQYPATKTEWLDNQSLRFLSGEEQFFRNAAAPLRRWTIRLSRLDQSEMAAIEQFFLDNEGRGCNFVFSDPWSGTDYPNCSLANDELDLTWQAEMSGETLLTVTEGRG
jgi:hypothetical protein